MSAQMLFVFWYVTFMNMMVIATLHLWSGWSAVMLAVFIFQSYDLARELQRSRAS